MVPPARSFAVELLGAGDYPATDGAAGRPDRRGAVGRRPRRGARCSTDPVCVAFDVSSDPRTAIVAAGMNTDGRMQVEVVSAGAGTGWLVDRMTALYGRHEVAEVVCDGFGPSGAVAKRVEDAGVTVRRLNAGDYAEACGLFLDAVAEKQLRHIVARSSWTAAVRGARPRPLVDRWAWSRTRSLADISAAGRGNTGGLVGDRERARRAGDWSDLVRGLGWY